MASEYWTSLRVLVNRHGILRFVFDAIKQNNLINMIEYDDSLTISLMGWAGYSNIINRNYWKIENTAQEYAVH